MLTGGKLPYPVVEMPDPDSEGDTIKKLDYSSDPIPPSSINDAVPDGIGSVALRTVETSIDGRYATPAEFKNALLEQSGRQQDSDTYRA